MIIRILKNNPDLATDGFKILLADLSTINQDTPGCGQLHAIEMTHKSGFSGPVRPDERNFLSLTNPAVQVFEDLMAVGIGKTNIIGLYHELFGHSNLLT